MNINELTKLTSLMPGLVVIGQNRKIIAANNDFLDSVGFTKNSDYQFTDYADVPSEASVLCDDFAEQDRITLGLQSSIKTYNLLKVQDEWRMFYSETKPLHIESLPNSTICQLFDITNWGLVNTLKVSFNIDDKLENKLKPFTKIIIPKNKDPLKLTCRQLSVLILLIRGGTAKTIATKLKCSTRTIESHIQELKYKFNCSVKSQLIEKAIDMGYMTYLPESFF